MNIARGVPGGGHLNIWYRLAELLYKTDRPAPPLGDYVSIGKECFGLADGSVLCWRGENYVPMKSSLRVRLHNWLIKVGSRSDLRDAA